MRIKPVALLTGSVELRMFRQSTAPRPGRCAVNRVFVDMDGVIVDFDQLKSDLGVDVEALKGMQGAFRRMRPMPGAIEGVRSLIAMGFEVWIASKPVTGVPHCYSEKVEWILNHLPELKRRIILTHDKGLLGDAGDVLIDDRPHKANCQQFPGTLIVFGGACTWDDVVRTLARRRRTHTAADALVG